MRAYGEHPRGLPGKNGIATLVDTDGHQLHEPAPGGIGGECVGKVVEAEPQTRSAEQCGDHRVWSAEFGLIAVHRPAFHFDGFTYCPHHGCGDAEVNGSDVFHLQAALTQRDGGVDARMREIVGRVRLKKDVRHEPGGAQRVRERRAVKVTIEKAVGKAETSFKGSRRSGEAALAKVAARIPAWAAHPD